MISLLRLFSPFSLIFIKCMTPSGNVGSCVIYFLLFFFVEIYPSLVNRTFRVRVGDTLSLSFDQVEGVLQGSALNVHCFALAINSIVTAHPDGVS